MIALIDQQLLKLGLDVLDDPLGMETRHYLVLLTVEKDYGNVETNVLAEVYVEGVVFAADSFLEDTSEGRLHVAKGHLDYEVGD